jgi:hypothetical protein
MGLAPWAGPNGLRPMGQPHWAEPNGPGPPKGQPQLAGPIGPDPMGRARGPGPWTEWPGPMGWVHGAGPGTRALSHWHGFYVKNVALELMNYICWGRLK